MTLQFLFISFSRTAAPCLCCRCGFTKQRSLTISVSEVKTAAAVFYNPESLLSFLSVLPLLKKPQKTAGQVQSAAESRWFTCNRVRNHHQGSGCSWEVAA